MTTQGEVLADVRSRLDESTGRQWTDEELLRWINDGLRDVARRAEVLQSVEDISAVQSTQQYDMPERTIRVHRVEWRPEGSTQVYPLIYQDFHNMDSVWVASQETSIGYPLYYTMWGYPPSLKIVLYPTPSMNGVVKVYFYTLPTPLATDGSDADTDLDLPTGWEDLIALYCEYVAFRKDADPRWQESKSLYEESLGDLMDVTRRWTDQSGSIATETGLLPQWLYGGQAW